MLSHMDLIDYFDKVRGRTMRVAACIPPERIEWTYAEGKFTFGDLLRHLGSIERWMFAENAALRPSRYPGHGRELADGYDAIIDYVNRMHAESMEIFRAADLAARTTTPGGASMTVEKWIRSMVEHEIHHRGQIYVYLGILGIDTPPLYGLKEEEVKARSVQGAGNSRLRHSR
jgi:uncharacterized damage-inducible protein DinB